MRRGSAFLQSRSRPGRDCGQRRRTDGRAVHRRTISLRPGDRTGRVHMRHSVQRAAMHSGDKLSGSLAFRHGNHRVQIVSHGNDWQKQKTQNKNS